jgi:hypothetical protein
LRREVVKRNLLHFYGLRNCLVALLIAIPAYAQVAMPDASQMSGTPLPAPELPNATVTVRVVRERMGNNLSGQTVTLSGAGMKKTGVSDAQGRVTFTDFATGTAVTAEVTVDGETITSQTFPVPTKGGVRVALVAGIAKAKAAEEAAAAAGAKEPARPGIVEFGGESRIILEYQSDTLSVFYLLEVINNARTPIDVGGPLLFDLPQGAAGGSKLDGSSAQVSVNGEHVVVTGPFAPGKTSVQIGYSLPNAGQSLVLQQKWPAAMEQVLVAVEKIGPMQLTSPQLKDMRDMNSEGQSFIMGQGGRMNAGDTLVLNLTGLPARSPMTRYAVFGLGLAILLVGLWFGITPPAAEKTASAKLHARRDKLLADLVTLERKRLGKPLSPADAAKRERLVDELERVMSALDQGQAA